MRHIQPLIKSAGCSVPQTCYSVKLDSTMEIVGASLADVLFSKQRWRELLFSDTALFSRSLFIGSHGKDVGHNQNADTPGKSDPYLLSHWLSSQ